MYVYMSEGYTTAIQSIAIVFIDNPSAGVGITVPASFRAIGKGGTGKWKWKRKWKRTWKMERVVSQILFSTLRSSSDYHMAFVMI